MKVGEVGFSFEDNGNDDKGDTNVVLRHVARSKEQRKERERRKFIRDLVEINANDSIFDSYVYAGVGKK